MMLNILYVVISVHFIYMVICVRFIYIVMCLRFIYVVHVCSMCICTLQLSFECYMSVICVLCVIVLPYDIYIYIIFFFRKVTYVLACRETSCSSCDYSTVTEI